MAPPGSPIPRPPNRRDQASIDELTESECLDHLRRVAVGRLAVQLSAGVTVRYRSTRPAEALIVREAV